MKQITPETIDLLLQVLSYISDGYEEEETSFMLEEPIEVAAIRLSAKLAESPLLDDDDLMDLEAIINHIEVTEKKDFEENPGERHVYSMAQVIKEVENGKI